ncbi:putative signal transduction protein with CBS domains [Halorhabdus utahensis DSM 12940]|uniref:Putative signal transduction protein with CBS domains n=1 Tax=Halorhabdus utahensis (strain DSM 12940 / JCM 11049 / AX-2) TaxID=519442 RepID=C7NTD2_HALUD|nr:CBS domain-containing protein [Halorhabdus utahensis]ACV10854.1 putative signal transduction protein with CBS domains [Halorhabdus utahensis DSM 12940]
MNGSTNVREVMRRDYVGVSESDGLVEAGRLLRDERADGAVVLRGNEPVGTVSSEDVLDQMLEVEDPTAETVSDAMESMVPRIDVDDHVESAADQLLSNSVSLLVVLDERDEVAGVITKDDLVRSVALNRDAQPDGSNLEPARTEATNETDAGYSNQGICERCGALTSDLISFNGQLLCTDCRDV